MNRPSMFFLLILAILAAMALYEALFPLPSYIVFTRFFGLGAFFLLCVSLMIGPLAMMNHKEFGPLVEPRRAVGIAAFALVLGHIALAVGVEYGWQLGEMLTLLPIQLSLPAALIMMALAITSSDYAVKAMGPALWKRVQQLNYLVFALSFAHFLLSATGLFASVNGMVFLNLDEAFAVLLGLAVIALQVWGFFHRRRKEAEWKAKEKKDASPKEASSAS